MKFNAAFEKKLKSLIEIYGKKTDNAIESESESDSELGEDGENVEDDNNYIQIEFNSAQINCSEPVLTDVLSRLKS